MEDQEAKRQIDQMVSFIINEAKDKAAEIEAKSLEDFNVEKLKVLQTMKDKIRAEYRKKAKQLENERAIARSTAINKSRLKRIAARQLKINEGVKSAAKSLAELSTDNSKYSKLCTDLIVQGMLRLLEDTVVIRCRMEDRKSVEASLQAAEMKYTQILNSFGVTNHKCKAILDTQNFLPSYKPQDDNNNTTATTSPLSCTGGVIVQSQDGRIVCDNTLDRRLELVIRDCLPTLRKILYE